VQYFTSLPPSPSPPPPFRRHHIDITLLPLTETLFFLVAPRQVVGFTALPYFSLTRPTPTTKRTTRTTTCARAFSILNRVSLDLRESRRRHAYTGRFVDFFVSPTSLLQHFIGTRAGEGAREKWIHKSREKQVRLVFVKLAALRKTWA
jgi:hypothetical protein